MIAGDETSATVTARNVQRWAERHGDISKRIDAGAARLAGWEATTGNPADEVLDWWSELSKAVREGIVDAPSVAEANAAFKRHFAAVFIDSPGGGPIRLDFVLRDRPPGAPTVSSSV